MILCILYMCKLTMITCCKGIGASKRKDVIIIITGWMRYAQYVKRLSGKNPRYDKMLLIGPAYPQLHESVIQIKANPQAI